MLLNPNRRCRCCHQVREKRTLPCRSSPTSTTTSPNSGRWSWPTRTWPSISSSRRSWPSTWTNVTCCVWVTARKNWKRKRISVATEGSTTSWPSDWICWPRCSDCRNRSTSSATLPTPAKQPDISSACTFWLGNGNSFFFMIFFYFFKVFFCFIFWFFNVFFLFFQNLF